MHGRLHRGAPVRPREPSPPSDRPVPGPVAGAARPTEGETADLAGMKSRAERFGHRFGEAPARAPIEPPLAPRPAAGPAPIQRVRWRWNLSTQSWSVVGSSSSTSTPPTHQGTADGEEFDDTYDTLSDPTVTPFLKKGEKYFGESGARAQLKGKKTSAERIRVPAKKTKGLRAGSGLHEVVPTNLKDEVAGSGSEILVGLQSGFRTSTSKQLFRRKSDKRDKLPVGSEEVGTHTGFAPKKSGRGSTHTKGQGPAHDRLRKASRKVKKEKDADVAINELALAHLDTTPTGSEVLASPYITGLLPNDSSIGEIGPLSTSGPVDPERIKLAKRVHRERERVKVRARSIKRQRKRGRSPSPPRLPIDDLGQGGGYVGGDRSTYTVEPVPSFGSPSSTFDYTARQSSWLSAPQREGFDFGPFTPSLPVPSPSTPQTPPTPAKKKPKKKKTATKKKSK